MTTNIPENQILIDKQLIKMISGFLIASSNFSDEGKIPYPQFQWTSHYLGHHLAEMLDAQDSKEAYRNCYQLFDECYAMYENDPKTIEFAKKLEEFYRRHGMLDDE